MMLPEQKKNHLEMLHDGEDLMTGWYWQTQEGGIAAEMREGNFKETTETAGLDVHGNKIDDVPKVQIVNSKKDAEQPQEL